MPPEPISPQMDALYTAIALNRSIAVLEGINGKIKSTSEYDHRKTSDYLYELYIDIHKSLFQDLPYTQQTPPEKRMALRAALRHLSSNGTAPDYPPLFNADGFATAHDTHKLARALAGFYNDMRTIRPFENGNKLTLDLFMVALTRLPGYKEAHPEGALDFRRLSKEDVEALHSTNSSPAALTAVFEHALDGKRTPQLENKESGFYKWPDRSKTISEIPFLSYTKTDGTKEGMLCLVTVNGGLVPYEKIKKQLEAKIGDHQISDVISISSDQLVGFLPGTEELRLPGKKFIDGFAVSNGAAPLFCLDLDVLTGLRAPDKKEVEDLVARVSKEDGRHYTLRELADDGTLKKRLLQETFNSRLKRSIEIASAHLERAEENLKRISTELIDKGKSIPSDETPQLVISMGGAGSGKGLTRSVIRAQTGGLFDRPAKPVYPVTENEGDKKEFEQKFKEYEKTRGNFVEASLDKAREHFDLYKVLQAADHHSDDYFAIERPASLLREMVAEGAKKQHKNLLYDGTGIEYTGRYDKIVADFKKQGYRTQVVGVDKYLPDAIQRVIERYKQEHRALPWKVVTGKHVAASRAFMQAAEDKNLDKISLYANDAQERDKHYLMAESFAVGDSELLIKIKKHQQEHDLASYFQKQIRKRDDSLLRGIATDADTALDALIAKIPMKEDNVGFLEYGSGKTRRVLALYDVKRFKDYMEKGLMNPQASYEEGLLVTPSSLPHRTGSWRDSVTNSATGKSPHL